MNSGYYVLPVVAVLVVSIGLGSVLAAPQDIYWEGQTVELDDDIDADSVYLLYTDNQNEFITQLGSNSNGILKINTSKYGTGKFQVVPETGDNEIEYTVSSQSLNVTVNNSRAFDSEDIEFDINSKRLEFDVYLNSSKVDNETIVDALEIDNSRLDITDNGVLIEDIDVTEGNDDEVEMDTEELPRDNIEFVWNVTDTIDKSTANVITVQSELANAEFINGPYNSNVGNSVDINLTLQNTRDVKVQIGTKSYSHNVTLRDRDKDGEVSLTFDTYIAGQEGKRPVTTNDGGTTIVSQEDNQGTPNNLLAATSYTLEASVNGRTTSIDVMNLESFSQDGIDVKSMSSRKVLNYSNVVDASGGNEIAESDYAIFETKVSSIYSFVNNTTQPRQLEPDSTFSDKYDVSLTIEESEPRISGDAEEFELFKSEELFVNKRDNELYIVIDADNLPKKDYNDDEDEIDVVNEFEAEFEIDEDSPLVGDDVTVETDDELVVLENTAIPTAREVNGFLDSRAVDGYIFDRDEGTIEVKTPIAEGREIRAIIEGREINTASLGKEEVTNGTVEFNASRLSDRPVGTEFDLRVLTTSETHEMTVGINNVIEQFNLAKSANTYERVEANVELKDEYKNTSDLETTWGGNISLETEIIASGVVITDNTSGTIIGSSSFRTGRISTDSNNSAYLKYRKQGTYDVRTRVSSPEELLFDTREKSITLEQNISRPNVTIEAERESILFPSDEVEFTAIESNINNTDVTYQWKVNGKNISESKEYVRVFESGGTYNVSVTATNIEGESETENTMIQVNGGNQFTRSIFQYFVGS